MSYSQQWLSHTQVKSRATPMLVTKNGRSSSAFRRRSKTLWHIHDVDDKFENI